MKTTSSRFAWIAAGLLASSQICPARVWVDSTGRFNTEAEFVALTEGTVTLEAPDGRIIKLPLDRLSADDQALALKLGGAGNKVAGPMPDKNAKGPQENPDKSDIKVTAEAKLQPGVSIRNGEREEYVTLKIEVTALGGVAADAFAMGPVQVEPLMINGKAYKAEKGFGSEGFDAIDRNAKGIFADHPKDGVTGEIDFGKVPNDTAMAGSLKGSIQVMAGGTEKVVDINDLLKRRTATINDPALKSAGMSVKFIREGKGDDMNVGVELDGESANAFVGLELVDRQGQPLKSSSGSGTMNGVKQFQEYASEEVFKDAILRLRFRDGAEKVDIPFHLPEVEVSK